MNSTVKEEHIIIPHDKLSKDAFDGLIEEFILREGTDYGHSEVSLGSKKEKVFNQLKAGHIQVVYSSLTENTTLMTKDQIQKL